LLLNGTARQSGAAVSVFLFYTLTLVRLVCWTQLFCL
jgi:hypothetical protein